MKHFGTANEFVNLWFGLNREILNADMIKINCLNPEKFARAIEEFVREVQVSVRRIAEMSILRSRIPKHGSENRSTPEPSHDATTVALNPVRVVELFFSLEEETHSALCGLT